MMFAQTLPTLVIALIYIAFIAYRRTLYRRDRQLRERVAYMLWVMAHQPAD